VTLIAEHDEQWVGMAIGLAEAPGHSLTSGSTLVGMFVDGTARRSGVGLALVESVVAWARARRAACLALWVTSSNDAAIALYRRCGFQPTGATRSVAGEGGIEMVCDLND
jgi:GNAT superfamily N-acetyltransferase